MVGPNKQFDQAEALVKALQVFWDKGYEATSMQDLVNAMGINRASMYQTYGNKSALFNASLDHYIEQTVQHFNTLKDQPGSPLDNLKQLFINLITQSLEGRLHGCLINNTAIELGPHDPQVAAKVRDVWQRFEAVFSQQITRAMEQQEIRSAFSSDSLGQLLNVQLQGLIVKTKANTPKQDLYDNVELLFQLIRQ